MQYFLHSITDFFTPQPVQRTTHVDIIETVNDCGETRYIEVERDRLNNRKVNLEVLLTKCKRLLSFVETTRNTVIFTKLSSFISRVRHAMYTGDDIYPLFDEFERIESIAKKGSRTFSNLSDAL